MGIRVFQVGPSVLNAGAQDYKGSDAKMSIIVGAMAVSDLVKSTLGPKGMVMSPFLCFFAGMNLLIIFTLFRTKSCSLRPATLRLRMMAQLF